MRSLSETGEFTRLTSALSGGNASAGGLWGASAGLLIAAAQKRLSCPVLIIAPGPEEADLVSDDVAFFSGRSIVPFPAWDVLPTEAETPESEPTSARLEVCRRLSDFAGGMGLASRPPVVGASVQALLQPLPSPAAVQSAERTLSEGAELGRETFTRRLAETGYERVAAVEVRGEMAVRGGIVDLFPFVSGEAGEGWPYRIEFFGDHISSIRTFDPGTQRTLEVVESFRFEEMGSADVRRGFEGSDRASLAHHLPPGSLIVLMEPEEVQARAASYLASYAKPMGLYTWPEAWQGISAAKRLEIREITGASGSGLDEVDFEVRSAERLAVLPEGPGEAAGLPSAFDEMKALIDSEVSVSVLCDNEAERDRLHGILKEAGVEGVTLLTGRISAGFEFPKLRAAVLSDHEIFRRYPQRRHVRKREHTRALSDILQLEPGDLVVHSSHGVARYLHISTLEKRGSKEDYLCLMFRDDVNLYVPASHIHLIHKYVGTKGFRPKLSKLGGKAWVKRREKVEKAVRDIAEDLLATQAARQALPGIASAPDDEWQERFEAAFIYEETADQLAASEAIRRSMQSPYPMDRLLCGDVGFGKTEVAIRAAFRAVTSGRQVAVLVPTTVLAEQHYATFRERLADYPVLIESLSRFRTKGEQRDVIERMSAGTVDVVIGTHRLLQKDIGFRDLGLVIIDEEQRFGVEHKEFLKTLRSNVDVLTLTATPIPRTLHMALVGIRDISSLSIPPEDRLSIRTKVCRRDNDLIRRAVLRELQRDGQIFFIHNRVASIGRIAEELEALVPEAKIVYAHGQMPERLLAERMGAFIRGEADVLLATTIIENGIDIPRANTMFIDRADTFGLSELHQLRGRVGRYKHRAYAYLMVPNDRPMTREGRKRLKAIEEFDELGAGFRLAMRDMEIRGAGNVLGPEQSGHIAEIGYDLYCRLLENEVRRLRGQPAREDLPVTLSLGEGAFVPAEYVTEESLRLDVYRRIDAAETSADIDDLRAELVDRYGEPARPTERLLAESGLRILCRAARVPYAGIEGDRLVLKFHRWDLDAARDGLVATFSDVRFLDEDTISLPLEGRGYSERLGLCEGILKNLGTVLESGPGVRREPSA